MVKVEGEFDWAMEIFRDEYFDKVTAILEEATLKIPETTWFQKGGKQGIHTEHLGYLLSDLQYMQRTYPNMEW